MSRRRITPPDELRIALARTVGFTEYPTNATAEPYLNYIANRHIGRGTLEEYLRVFVRVVEHFRGGEEKQDVSPNSNSISALLEKLGSSEREELFRDTKAGSQMRKEDVEDTVMYIMGAWTMMLGSFVQLSNGFRKVTAAYRIQAQAQGIDSEPFEDNLSGLIKGSNLLPAPGNYSNATEIDPKDDIVKTAMRLVSLLSEMKGMPNTLDTGLENSLSPSLFDRMDSKMSKGYISYHSLDDVDSLESLSIKGTKLNAFRLKVLGAVDIVWTHNMSRHMLLSSRGRRHVLELFAFPCVFNASTITSDLVGISSELAQEIQESYSILFNAWPDTPLHVKLGFLAIRRFCWCWSCSAHRYRSKVISKYKKSFNMKSRKAKRNQRRDQKSEFDPMLVELMTNDGTCDWTYDLFPSLWQRITLLQEHLQAAKPWSIWILFRDRRDTLQFWTFCFATLVVFLTFLQVALGVAQVVGSFQE